MKLTVNKPVEIEADAVRVTVPVRYEEEDIPNGFPLRIGNVWSATINLETGKIDGWPANAGEQSMHMKVCDGGVYELLSGEKVMATKEGGYVPSFMPGAHFRDYIIFDIDANGVIKGWKVYASDLIDAFFGDDD